MPCSTRSLSNHGLTTWNSPARTRRVYIFCSLYANMVSTIINKYKPKELHLLPTEVYGSKHSLKPKICEVDAVGMGATSNELRTPCLAIFFLSLSQSHKSDGSTPHISYCKIP